ncbi:unnamed protein product [Rangifer tarandus platyrhynchus]|uniref:Uncharacterized protein n=1 Tax=Rangifer tarandus platyrhynchus TaxID=3082113 RepID=A0AC59ZGL5_RANTA
MPEAPGDQRCLDPQPKAAETPPAYLTLTPRDTGKKPGVLLSGKGARETLLAPKQGERDRIVTSPGLLAHDPTAQHPTRSMVSLA